MGVIIEEVDILPTEKNPWSLWGVFHGGTDTLPLSSHYHRNEVFKTGGVRRTLSWKYHNWKPKKKLGVDILPTGRTIDPFQNFPGTKNPQVVRITNQNILPSTKRLKTFSSRTFHK